MMRCLFGLLLAVFSSLTFAGYAGNGQCYSTIQEAVSRAAYYKDGACTSGDCRILSFVPASGTAQVISQGSIIALSISPCDVVDSTLPTYIQPSPWYGSDPGTVSACGSTVQTTGGVAGSGGGSGVSELVPLSMSVADAQTLAASILGIWAIAFGFKSIYRILNDDDNEPKAD